MHKEMSSMRWLVAVLASYLLIKRLVVWYRNKKMVIQARVNKSMDRVLNAFAANFSEGREKGAQLVCTVNGETVLDVRGGRDSTLLNDLTMVFSCTKVLESLAIAILVDQGKLAYEDAIAKHWPEFGKCFSPHTTVAQLMRHEAGLDEIQDLLTFAEAERVFATGESLRAWLLATMRQRKDCPGTTYYHAATRGLYIDALCSLCDGRRIKEFIQEEIMDKLGKNVEFHLGCDKEDESLRARIAVCEPDATVLTHLLALFLNKTGLSRILRRDEDDPDYVLDYEASVMIEFAKGMALGREGNKVTKSFAVFSQVGSEIYMTANDVDARRFPLSSCFGVTNAYTLARVGQELAKGGGMLLSPQALRRASQHADAEKWDNILHLGVIYTDCGWGHERFRKDWIGWDGAGGSLFVWSPKHKASFAYVPSMLDSRLHRARGLRMLNEFIKALE